MLITATAPAGYAVAHRDGLAVALDTTLTPALRQAGLARDLVRLIQDARKLAGNALADRIDIVLHPPSGLDLKPLLAAHGRALCGETQARTLSIGPLPSDFVALEIALEGETLQPGVRR